MIVVSQDEGSTAVRLRCLGNFVTALNERQDGKFVINVTEAETFSISEIS